MRRSLLESSSINLLCAGIKYETPHVAQKLTHGRLNEIENTLYYTKQKIICILTAVCRFKIRFESIFSLPS